jgi:hypothetical protein
MSRGPPYPGDPDGVGARPEPVDPEPVDDGPNQASPQGAKRRLSVLFAPRACRSWEIIPLSVRSGLVRTVCGEVGVLTGRLVGACMPHQAIAFAPKSVPAGVGDDPGDGE